jgi:glucokinase
MPAPSNKSDYVVGVDLGATKIYAGLFTPNLSLVGASKMTTKPLRGQASVLDRIARCVKDVVDECDLTMDKVKAVGIGAPGAVDPEVGRVILAPNLGWQDVPIEKELQKRLDVPVAVENDANAALIGVYEEELESKPRHVLGIFIGTGIGGALIINGELYSGFNHSAGEIGHMTIDIDGPKCGCGKPGCFEALASRTAIFQKVKAAVADGQKTILTEMLGEKLEGLRSGDLRKAIQKGDKFVAKCVEDAAEYAGIAAGSLINLLNPEVVVLGGGLIEALSDVMMPRITKIATGRALAGTTEGIQIKDSMLGDKAGIFGAAVLARRRTK